jgi:hypothetical protein
MLGAIEEDPVREQERIKSENERKYNADQFETLYHSSGSKKQKVLLRVIMVIIFVIHTSN